MSIVVTGASGHLGRLTVAHLLELGVPAEEITATTRDVDRLKDLAEKGVAVHAADYTDTASLRAAFRGADRLLLVSGHPGSDRLAEHRNAVEAARAAGVGLLAYTSVVNAQTSGMIVAADHAATETLIADSGLSFVFLCNNWYHENYTARISAFLQHGTVIGGAGDGRVSGAARADYAEAAAEVLTGHGHENRIYELGGDPGYTLTELAAEITRQSGTEVRYRDVPETAHLSVLAETGLPEPMAQLLADVDQGIRRGGLYTDSGDLARLIGRPTTPLATAIATATALAAV
ncbi:MAG TPA: SDR family oxidoreductase [Pseudonocardiaceae bacterium]|jgi:NAD(P)H dehydrogenase (quinone)